MTRHLGVALLAAVGLWSAGRASAACLNLGNKGCNYDCDCDCGYVCDPNVPKHCVLSKDNPLNPGHCDVNFTSCACNTGNGSATKDQTCVAGSCSPTWAELDDGGFLIYKDAGPPPVQECQFDFDCPCGNHCLIVNPPINDGGFHCVSFADAGGPTGGSCSCSDNNTCVSATCGCPGVFTCLCDNGNCDDGGAGTCHAPDAGPPPPNDAGYDCMIDVDCPAGCGTVCSHAMAYWLCVPAGSDPGFCNGNLDCPCPAQLCDLNDHSCKDQVVDAGVDAGKDAGGTGTTGGTTGGGTTTSGGTTGSSGCSSGSSGGLAGLGVLALLAATLLSRRREFAGRR